MLQLSGLGKITLKCSDQYSENEYTTQSNLQIQRNPHQATNGIFQRARTNNFTICMVQSWETVPFKESVHFIGM